MLLTLGGGQNPLPDPPPAWSLRSLAVKASFCCFIVLHIFHPMPFCAPPPPGKKFLDPPLMPIPLELRGALPLDPTLRPVIQRGLHVRVGWFGFFFCQPSPPKKTFLLITPLRMMKTIIQLLLFFFLVGTVHRIVCTLEFKYIKEKGFKKEEKIYRNLIGT